jgi:hypothetical protein
MKTRLLLIAAFTLFAVELVAQNDSTEYRFGLPVGEDDTTSNFPPGDIAPENRMIAVPVNQLPEKVLKALTSEEQYDGWRDTTVYLEKNTGLYHVPVKTQDGIRIFGLNKDGHPVTFDVVTEPPK